MSDVTPSKADKTSDEPVDPALDETPETPAEAAEEAAAVHEAAPARAADEPIVDETPVGEPAPELVQPEPVSADTAAVESAVAEPAVDPEPATRVEPEPVLVPAAVAAASAVPAQQAVYTAPPIPPKKRGNRGIGVLLALVGAILFAGLYAVVVVLINHVQGGRFFGAPSAEFVNVFGSAYFTVAVGAFLVLMILLVLFLNRAGWWAHVLGSLLLAVAVYFATIGGLLFIGNEVSIWSGLGIAARGRRVKARNVEARQSFDREQEATRAEYAGTGTVSGV
jgi:hypothetical protein